MRDIIFRGKRQDDGTWAEGCFYHDDKHARILLEDRSGLWNIAIIPETVGEFTGLYDCNGKKVFEGDIIKTHYANAAKADFVEEVVFHGCGFCAMAKISDNGRIYSQLPNGSLPCDNRIYMDRMEVIGNIHDHRYLLKKREV